MWILIVLFVLLFLLLLLSMPLIVEARGRVGVCGAVVHAKIWLFGLIPIPLRWKIYLLEKPCFTLRIGKKQVPLLQRQMQAGKPRIEGVRLLKLDTCTTVGVEGEPAAAVLLAGTVAVLLSMLTTRVAQSGSARAGLCEAPLVRISMTAQAIVFPLPLLRSIAKRRRISRRKAANNTRKTNEKRTSYASC